MFNQVMVFEKETFSGTFADLYSETWVDTEVISHLRHATVHEEKQPKG